MTREYELTDTEYRAVIDALMHAEANAVSSDAAARFQQTMQNLLRQHGEQERPQASGTEGP